MRIARKKLWLWLKVAVMAYCLIGIAIYYLQDYILFSPVVLKKDSSYNFEMPHRELNIPFTENSNINVIQFQNTATVKRGVVLYFHGNKQNIARYTRFVPAFTDAGYELWMLDYPGFGKSTGDFTEQNLYDWAFQLYKLARARFAPNNIIIYGKSMGTGVASQLASVADIKQLILETPYYSLPSLISNYLPVYPVDRMIHYKMPTWQYLQQVTVPVTIFHGTNDWVIPYRNASKLRRYLKKTDLFVTLDGGSHRGLWRYPLFTQTLDSLLKR